MTHPASPDDPVPAGFRPLERGGPYFSMMGPHYQRPADDGGLVIGLRITDKHTNTQGITHGGMLATLADAALGINLSIARQPSQPMVTVHLGSDFIGPARPGDWMEAHVRVVKQGRRLSFGDCELRVGDRLILRCSGVFSVIGDPASQLPSDG